MCLYHYSLAISCLQVCSLSRPHDDVLDVSPAEAGLGLQDQGDDPGRHGGGGRGPRVGGGAAAVEVRGDHLPLPLPAAAGAVGGGQGGAALLAVPGDVPVLTGAADAHGEDARGVAVTVAVVLKLASVTAEKENISQVVVEYEISDGLTM